MTTSRIFPVSADERFCLDPLVGEQRLSDYLTETLSSEQRAEFEHHLSYCLKCHEDLEYLTWIFQQVTTRNSASTWEDLNSTTLYGEALEITSIYDWNQENLTHVYYDTPLMERLAASSDPAESLTFPITVEYADGRVIGQFWQRAGQLSYRLTKSPPDQVFFLLYLPIVNPSKVKTFEVHLDVEQWLGDIREFIAADTPTAIVHALKQFHLYWRHTNEQKEC